jgi:MoxR-like ATPase
MSRISSPLLVGRTEELALLVAALASGEPRTLLLGGEAGIGKTRLLAEFRARARSAGARVLTGRLSACRRGRPALCADLPGATAAGP